MHTDGRPQVLIVQVPDDIARRAKRFVASTGSGYASLSELVVVALQNQLLLHELQTSPDGAVSGDRESDGLAGSSSVLSIGTLRPQDIQVLLHRPEDRPPDTLQFLKPAAERLFVLTNRLGPLKIGARVLANLRLMDGNWPTIEQFTIKAAQTARALGARLRAEDERKRARGPERRATGFPIGPEAEKALDRFVSSFTLVRGTSGRAVGPMAILCLADVRDGRAILTDPGWELAAACSPLLGECDGHTLGEDEREILRNSLLSTGGETKGILQTAGAIQQTSGRQIDVDKTLGRLNPSWSPMRVVAERASMIGRLRDVGIVELNGRGEEARVILTPRGEKFVITAREHVGGRIDDGPNA